MDVPHAEEKVAILACTPFEPFSGSRHIFLQSPVTDGTAGSAPGQLADARLAPARGVRKDVGTSRVT